MLMLHAGFKAGPQSDSIGIAAARYEDLTDV
jgi:hypothetical protein